MPFAETLSCPRCNHTQPATTPLHRGCEACVDEGLRVNLVCDVPFDTEEARRAIRSSPRRSLWDFIALLPLDLDDRVDLGEGWTPLLPLPQVGAELGLRQLWAKNEAVNPTWSHKDRLCALSTGAARRLGATATTAVSTGNHGASVAAYATRAGMPSVIFTLQDVPKAMLAFINAYGAAVIAAPTVAVRNELMRSAIERYGLFPVSNAVSPSMGSTPFGVDGYKTLAYEIWLQLGEEVPDWVVVPVGYGDCLSGVARGFHDLVHIGLAPRVPRMVAAEVFGAVGAALAGTALPRSGEPTSTSAFSIATTSATDQSLRAIRGTGGVAVTAAEDEIVAAQRLMAVREGLFLEASAAAGVAAAARLAADGVIRPDDTVVTLATSTGLKDPIGAAAWQRPVVNATSDEHIRTVIEQLLDA